MVPQICSIGRNIRGVSNIIPGVPQLRKIKSIEVKCLDQGNTVLMTRLKCTMEFNFLQSDSVEETNTCGQYTIWCSSISCFLYHMAMLHFLWLCITWSGHVCASKSETDKFWSFLIYNKNYPKNNFLSRDFRLCEMKVRMQLYFISKWHLSGQLSIKLGMTGTINVKK